MLLARIVCSDPLCAEELDVSVEELDELDSLICECGFGFVLVDVAELRQIGSVIAFPGQVCPPPRGDRPPPPIAAPPRRQRSGGERPFRLRRSDRRGRRGGCRSRGRES